MKNCDHFYELINLHLPVHSIHQLIDHILLDYDIFYTQSGSAYKGQHHYGTGGLAQHTYEVLEFCLKNMKDDMDKEVVILSALYHDLGKIYDYFQLIDGSWVPAKHKKRIRHISKSAMIFYENANKAGFPLNKREEVLHCILSHHMRLEWGSPVTPDSKEAWLLTLCDHMSARFDDVDSWDYAGKE